MEIINWNYFVWGYPNQGHAHYALYQPSFDGFLVVGPDPELLQQTAVLVSSRYSLYPIRIDCAVNYQHNLIDNSVCHRWSLGNKHQLAVPRSLDFQIVDAITLVDSVCKIDHDVEKEKLWTIFIYWWMRFIDLIQKHFYKYFDLDCFINSFLELPSINSYYDQWSVTKKQILRELYLGHTIDQTLQELHRIISQNQTVEEFYVNLPKNSLR